MAGQLARDELDHGGRRGRGSPLLLGGEESRFTQPTTHFLDHVGEVGRRRRFERKGIGSPGPFQRPMNDGDQLVGAEQMTDTENMSQRQPLIGPITGAMPRRDDLGEPARAASGSPRKARSQSVSVRAKSSNHKLPTSLYSVSDRSSSSMARVGSVPADQRPTA